ncbi:hypothetical protein [Mixta intestinalis]|uniref:Uncharacterized protein n=1 Tax=Mixta intestinalis TaxID=1615494 RepID=A0A6P1Q0F4_9GAMM|nr:hypothetical protein [Mixta intestinalis]QHM71589.1 hypothetical protein C7M51_01880 [Mixta intestinalis]
MSTNEKASNERISSRRKALTKILVSAAAVGTIGSLTRANAAPASAQPESTRSKIDGAPGIILDHASTSWAKIRSDVHNNHGPVDNYAALQQLAEDKKYLTIDTPVSINKSIKLTVKNQIIEGRGNGIITPLRNMSNEFLLELKADATQIHGMVFDNPMLLKSETGGRQGGIMISANYCEIANCYFYRMLQSVVAPAGFGAWGTKIVNNWFLECLGAGTGMRDLRSKLGEDRGDAVTIWGSGTIMTGNHAYCKAGEDARLAFHAEGLPGARKYLRDFDHKDIIMANNMAKGSFRRHFAMENITDGISIGNISMGGATWWGEAYIQCKNINVKNTIRYSNSPDIVNGKAWRPIKAAIAVVNFNEGINIDSTVLIAKGTEAYGFAIATQTGEHDITLSGSMINEGARTNTALYLNQPKSFRINNLDTQGFARAAQITTGKDVTITSSNCYHQLNGTGKGMEIVKGTGGNIAINGDTYNGATTVFKLPNVDNLSIQNTRVSGSERFAELSGIKQSLLVTHNMVSADKSMALVYSDGSAPDISWLVEGNIGIRSNFTYTSAQLSSLNSNLNQRSKHAGKNVCVNSNAVYVALGGAPESPWLNLATQKMIKPV